jgi:hypothetical protein
MIAEERVKEFLDEHPELAEAMRVFQMSTENYTKALEAMNPVVKYTGTSSRDLGPGSDR